MPRAITRKLFFPPTSPDGFRRRPYSSGGAGRGAASKKHGRWEEEARMVACARCWYTENSVDGYTWMAQMVGQVECCNLAPVPFLSILFLESPETRLFFDKISHGESNRVSGNNTRIVVRYTATNRVHVNETSWSEVRIITKQDWRSGNRWRQCQARSSSLTSVSDYLATWNSKLHRVQWRVSTGYEAYGPKSFSKRKFTTAFTWQDGSCAAWLKASTVETSRETSSQLSAVTCTNSDLWCQGPWLPRLIALLELTGPDRSTDRPTFLKIVTPRDIGTRYTEPPHPPCRVLLNVTYISLVSFQLGCFASSVIRANTIFPAFFNEHPDIVHFLN